MSMGEILRLERTKRGVSQAALARRTGIAQPAISRIESGGETPSLERLQRLMAGLGLALNLEPTTLATFTGDPRHMPGVLRLHPGQRLEQSASWARLARELHGKARGKG